MWATRIRLTVGGLHGRAQNFGQERLDCDTNFAKLDHFVPLAIGGHPRSEDNLWLQRWDGEWNARIKDRLERRLQMMVCAGRLTLHIARTAVQDDWRAPNMKYVAAKPAAVPRGM